MPRSILEEIINDFQIEKFSEFFNLKMRSQGNFRPSTEKLSSYNDDDFNDFRKIGQIEFSPTEKLVIIGSNSIKSLSERSGKKNQFKKAKRILKDLSSYSSGIFIFFDSIGNFRFSLIYPEAIGSKREWSNFRRYTYFVSKEFKNKTFLREVGSTDFATLEKIKDAFSVEKVTKEFYLEYRKLFDSLVKELAGNHTFIFEASKNNINTEDFAKKLLGQIVFLYFVQKKGWIGVPSGGKWGEGNKNFISDLFKESVKKEANFFNDYLEKLFYNALNNSRRNSTDPSFSKDFNCRIPFLNGGLFEAEYDWENSLIYLNNKIFEDIFEVFDRYNFTVEEESPDDKEIAVDPEMLGKVFENLLPENLRKGKGTYYTPREIVYYMCQESLINYLDSNSNIGREKAEHYVRFMRDGENKAIAAFEGEVVRLDELLKNVKVCDPACGSGAFLVGMLNEIVRLRILLRMLHSENLDRKTEYELKKETIQNCIYGVDIDPGAIEIAKLRLWLSLVVDYELEEIEPLPNLDYRLMCGNSLLEEFEGVKFYNGEESEQKTLLIDARKQHKIAELKIKLKEYFNIHDDEQKKNKRKEINDIKDWLVRSALEKKQKDLAAKRRNEEAKADMLDQKSREKYLASWGSKFLAEEKIKEVLANLHNPKKEKPFFIWKLEFVDVFEDKKGFDIIIANPPYVRVDEIDESLKIAYKQLFSTALGKYDLYYLFFEKEYFLLNEKGFCIFISPNKFCAADSAMTLRKIMLDVMHIQEILSTSKLKIFDQASNYPIITSLVKLANINKKIIVRQVTDINFLNERQVPNSYVAKPSDINNLPNSVIPINTDQQSFDLIKKLYSPKLLFSKLISISEGLRIPAKLESNEKQDFEIVKQYQFSRYSAIKSGTYVSQKNLSKIISDSSDRYAKIISQKILIMEDALKISATIDKGNMVPQGGVYFGISLKPELSISFMAGILNSRLLSFIYKTLYAGMHMGGGYLRYRSKFLESLPITEKIINPDQESIKSINEFVDKILLLSKTRNSDNNAEESKIQKYEEKIDQMVYELYNLTPAEIEIVENSKNK